MDTGPTIASAFVDMKPFAGLRTTALEALGPMFEANAAMARRIINGNRSVVSEAVQANLAKMVEGSLVTPAVHANVARLVEGFAPAVDPRWLKPATEATWLKPVIDTSRFAEMYRPVVDTKWLAQVIGPVVDASRFAAMFRPALDDLLSDAFDMDASRFADVFEPAIDDLLSDGFDTDAMSTVDLWDQDDTPGDILDPSSGVRWRHRTWAEMDQVERYAVVLALGTAVQVLLIHPWQAAADSTVAYNPSASIAHAVYALWTNLLAYMLVKVHEGRPK